MGWKAAWHFADEEAMAAFVALQDVDDVYDLEYAPGVRYGDVFQRAEWEWSTYNFEKADVALQQRLFDDYEQQVHALLGLKAEKGKGGKLLWEPWADAAENEDAPLKRLVLPAYDCVIKCSHYFNVLDVLAQDVGVEGVFSDWPATVTYYANCMAQGM